MPVPQSQTFGKQDPPVKEAAGTHRLNITRVTPLWPRRVYVQWILRNPVSGTGYFFDVFRSGSFEGPWTRIAHDLQDIYYYLDDGFAATFDRSGPDLQSIRREIVYKVTVRRTAPTILAEAVQDISAGLDHRRQGIHRKLARDAYVSLKKGAGTRVAVFKRRWWGTPCPKCLSLTGQSTRSHCGTCNGTGITYGYWDPVYTYAQRTASPVHAQVGVAGQLDINRMRALLPYIPQVDPLDFLVFLQDNKRYQIENIGGSEIHSVTVHQEVDITELARSSVEYNLKADPWRDPQWF
jgi:hypothetical protein